MERGNRPRTYMRDEAGGPEILQYVQRDLEDLIQEIKQEKMSEPIREIKINLKEVVDLINQGYTRYKKDDKGQGNIQEKLGLTFGQAKELFQDEHLKHMKSKPPKVKITIINDLEGSEPNSGTSADPGTDEIDRIFS